MRRIPQRRSSLVALVVAAVSVASGLVAVLSSSRARLVSSPSLLVNDAWVEAGTSEPGTGTGHRLEVARDPRRVAYLEFLVREATRAPSRVTLRLRALSPSEGAGIDVRATRSGQWNEDALRGSSAPVVGRVVRHHGRFRQGWVRFDLTRFVRRNGTYTFALTTEGRRPLAFAAGESGRHAPRLVIAGRAARNARAVTRPPGTRILSDSAAAARVRPVPETRRENARANSALPPPRRLEDFHSASPEPYSARVTGGFRGTTDEIIQWAAWKWGVDEDIMRAAAVQESDWHQGDVSDGGVSFGLFSVKTQLAPGDDGWPGTYPLAKTSTAFNADYYGRAFRSCLDGRETWLGGSYRAGDVWGCVGLWFSGDFHDEGGHEYVRLVKRWLLQRTWARPGY